MLTAAMLSGQRGRRAALQLAWASTTLHCAASQHASIRQAGSTVEFHDSDDFRRKMAGRLGRHGARAALQRVETGAKWRHGLHAALGPILRSGLARGVNQSQVSVRGPRAARVATSL